MNARLFCRTGQLAGAEFPIANDASIGKAADNSIQLYPEIISAHHARIYFDAKAGVYFIEDAGSSNGTRVDGMRVRVKTRLDEMNIITFANKFDFVFQVLGGEQGVVVKDGRRRDVRQPKPSPLPAVAPPSPLLTAPEAPAPSSPQAKTVFDDNGDNNLNLPGTPRPPAGSERRKTEFSDEFESVPDIPSHREQRSGMPDAERGQTKLDDVWPAPPPAARVTSESDTMSTPRRLLLLVNVAGEAPASYELHEGDNTIGRDPSCDVHIAEASMSRRHSCISVREGMAIVRDLGSKNGTFVGEARISHEQSVGPDDVLHFGLASATLKLKQQ